MEITKEDKRSVIDHCYLTYFISGMVILIFGVILPNLIEERNLSFTAAGGLLSFLAIGNLCSSLVYPIFCGMMSQKTAVVVLAIPYPVCLFLFTLGLPVPVLYVMIFLIGITKGMITIINNHAIRQVTGSSNQYLNLLHMWYAVGAFLSPFVTMLLMGAGMNWKTILRLLAVLTVLIVLSYATMDYRKIEKRKEGSRRGAQSGSRAKRKVLVLKERGIPSGSRHAVLLYGPRKLCKRMVCYLFKEHRLYVCKPCDCDGIRDLDHDHDRKDRHCKRLKEGAAGKDPGGDLHTAVRVGVDPRPRE